MFRLVALITFAILLVRNQILLINKQMIYRHLTFTFHFHFPHRVFFHSQSSQSSQLSIRCRASLHRMHPPLITYSPTFLHRRHQRRRRDSDFSSCLSSSSSCLSSSSSFSEGFFFGGPQCPVLPVFLQTASEKETAASALKIENTEKLNNLTIKKLTRSGKGRHVLPPGGPTC